MSYNTETINAQFINQAFMSKLDAGPEKVARVAMSAFVPQKRPDEGFTRKIL